jgi:steroid delta-isomerase-like uncharacterized protein
MMRRIATIPRGIAPVHAIVPTALGIAIALLLVGCTGASSGPSDDPTTTAQGEELLALADPVAATEANEANEAANIDAFFAKDLDAIMATYAEDAIFEDQTFGDYLEGASAVRGMYRSVMEITDADATELLDHFVSSDGSRAVLVTRWIGTNYLGRPFAIPILTLHEYRDGKIAKETLYYAAQDTYDQLTTSPSAE